MRITDGREILDQAAVDPRQRIEAVDMVRGFALFGVLMAFCTWWTKRFRFGPMEWLWRALTYLTLPPMRLQNKTAGRA